MSASLPKPGRRDGGASRQVGRYDVTSVLGKGAMGVVYRAHDPLLDRHVAIKVMAAALASEPTVRARFEREAQAAARLAHPNVVTVYDFGYHEGAPFVVMELLRGQDLRTALQKGAQLPVERRLSIVWQVLAGLGHAHGAGVVHRDVKPANVFLTDAGGVKVLDFGMARVTWAGSTGGGVVGTFDYMSPEQVESRRADGRSDVFSVGSVLFELLAGHPPFQADSMVSTAYRIVHGEPDFSALPEGEPWAALAPVLRKALAKDPAARHASAREFAAELAEKGGAPWRAWPVEGVPEAPAENAIAAEPDAGALAPPLATPSPRKIWAAAVTLAAAGLVAYMALRPAPVSAPASAPAPSAPPSATATPSTRATTRRTPPPRSEAAPPSPSQRAPTTAAESDSATVEALPAPVSGRVAPLSAVVGSAAPAATRGRWRGYLTDESCKHRGGVSGHWACAQVCLRKGFRPLLEVDGTLYRIDGLERVRGDRDRMVTVEGTLDAATATIHVES